MAEAFRGEIDTKVDGKARVSIPASFRRVLEADDPDRPEASRPRVYMVYGGKTRNFVECYSKAGADRLAEMIEEMEIGSKARDRAEREMISRSVMIEIEPDGRIVLPPKVRAKLGYGDSESTSGTEVTFVGTSDRFKLYRAEVYYAEDEDDDDDADVDPLALIGRARRAG
ncbi:division/cell wall cluster transcriptional repressor MraZ [Pseudogemmobacter sonorensis]|uniref:division/cell wall cluster transcriptional repressor MraZ n=1 Tax=Pseudogemmobacter sonorensis TaxID=2989681 RepID=UPI0036AD1CFB